MTELEGQMHSALANAPIGKKLYLYKESVKIGNESPKSILKWTLGDGTIDAYGTKTANGIS
ncbi:MAG: hypothetical protein LBI18_13320, partial [Planctomycetaceae bacterium]|nr:hypothetical protein [Planctomycetaceae bacterium]